MLTGPTVISASQPTVTRLPQPTLDLDMVRVGVQRQLLTATAALVRNSDLPRPLQQILFDTADGITPSHPARYDEQEPAAIRW